MIDEYEVKILQLVLLQRQHELRIARFLAGGIQLKSGPSLKFREYEILFCEERFKDALDKLWESQNETNQGI